MQGHIRGINLTVPALMALGLIALPGGAWAQATNPTDNPSLTSPVMPNTPVTINVESADLYYTLKLLFSQIHADFILDTSLRGMPVTVKLTKVPFGIALTAVLKASGQPLTYMYEDGIFSIIPQVTPPSFVPNGGVQEPPVQTTASTHYEKINLNTVSVYDIMFALGRPVVQFPAGLGGGMGGFGGGFGGGQGAFGGRQGGYGAGGQGGPGGFGGGQGGFGAGNPVGGFQGGAGGIGGANGSAQGAGSGFGAARGLLPDGIEDVFGFAPDNSIIVRGSR